MSEVPKPDGGDSLIPLPPANRVDPGQLSPDGHHYWDGVRWVSAYAPGGQHRWDGQSWVALHQGATPATAEQKRANLQYRLNYLIGHGYRVVSQTDTNAQLVRTKTFSFLWASLWFLLCGVGVLFYVFYYANKKDEQIYLQVDDYGRVFP